jgi:hypothetical protein
VAGSFAQAIAPSLPVKRSRPFTHENIFFRVSPEEWRLQQHRDTRQGGPMTVHKRPHITILPRAALDLQAAADGEERYVISTGLSITLRWRTERAFGRFMQGLSNCGVLRGKGNAWYPGSLFVEASSSRPDRYGF